MHVRVKAPNTGHEFDVPEDSILLNRGLVRRVKEKVYPPARYPRRPKHHLKLAPARARNVAASAGDETTTEERATMADVPSTPADGNIKTVLVPAIADFDAPTVAELTDPTAATIRCCLPP